MKKCCSFSYLSFPRRRESRGVNSGKDSRIGRIRATKTGVTLLEMIVVMAIIIIITAASIPSFLKFINTSRLRGSARDITTALRTARRLAITTRIHRRVTVYLVNSATESAVSFYETPDSIELQRAAANIYFTDGTPPADTELYFTFSPRGTAIVQDTIKIIDPNNRYIDIKVNPATGRVIIEDIQ